jgi:hypothetical protein
VWKPDDPNVTSSFLEDPSLTFPLLQGIGAALSGPYLLSLVKEAEQLAPEPVLPRAAVVLEPRTLQERQIKAPAFAPYLAPDRPSHVPLDQ